MNEFPSLKCGVSLIQDGCAHGWLFCQLIPRYYLFVDRLNLQNYRNSCFSLAATTISIGAILGQRPTGSTAPSASHMGLPVTRTTSTGTILMCVVVTSVGQTRDTVVSQFVFMVILKDFWYSGINHFGEIRWCMKLRLNGRIVLQNWINFGTGYQVCLDSKIQCDGEK